MVMGENMSRFAVAKATLLAAFITVAGCSDPDKQPAAAAPDKDSIFGSTFSFETEGLRHTMTDGARTVVFDFKADSMTVTDHRAKTSYTKSTNGPLTIAEESLARFAEGNVCYKMHEKKFDALLADDKVESINHARGCAAKGGGGQVNYRSGPG